MPRDIVEVEPTFIDPVVRDLTAAMDLIRDPYYWTQGRLARRHRNHTAYCALGALVKVKYRRITLPRFLLTYYGAARRYLSRAAGSSGILVVNDKRGHFATIEMYQQAIADRQRDLQRMAVPAQ